MASVAAEFHVGDVGAELVAQVIEWDEGSQSWIAVNISAATALTIYLTRPRGTGAGTETLTKTAVLDSDGADGMMRYTTVSGDFNVKGTYRIQAYVAGVEGFSGSTREVPFQVAASRHG